MKETLSNMWFVIFVLIAAGIQFVQIAVQVWKENRNAVI